MLAETTRERISRFEAATDCIIHHPPMSSFAQLISPNLSTFSGFRLLYSTDNIVTDFGGISLSDLESKCAALTRFFGGAGLLFYDDDLYEETIKNKEAKFLLGYSLTACCLNLLQDLSSQALVYLPSNQVL